MITQSISATRKVSAPLSAVWALVDHVETWSTWGPFETAELERTGATNQGGVGAIRRFRRGRWTTREEVTVYQPGRRVGYRLLSGIPVRDFDAEVTLEQRGSRTLVTWETTFRPMIPGTGRVLRRGLAAFVGEVLENLAAGVELPVMATAPSATRVLADATV